MAGLKLTLGMAEIREIIAESQGVQAGDVTLEIFGECQDGPHYSPGSGSATVQVDPTRLLPKAK